jgi:ABC-type phosphate/phosphonate transport system substrate-binding protein
LAAWFIGAAGLPAFLLIVCGSSAPGQQTAKLDSIRIGISGALGLGAESGKEEAAADNLRSFIKSETGFDNEIVQQKGWRELAEKLAGGGVQLGVFQGYEFAWAREKYPKLQPLALAINVHRYREAHVVTAKTAKAADFAALDGQVLALPKVGQAHLALFVERQSQANGKALNKFFSRVTSPDNIEDALDDAVDGAVGAAVVDRVGLEAYKRRKPARFSRLKEVARSGQLPPPLVAYQEGLNPDTLKRFQEGLLNARRKEKGQKLLNLFHLTGFETAPSDFDQFLAATRKAYPPPVNGAN